MPTLQIHQFIRNLPSRHLPSTKTDTDTYYAVYISYPLPPLG